eukprot:m.338562 g.338562  ORF g.338562 m.338562 type:complete len:611 (+) comp18463_c0_seq1:76-1908(+)
MKDMNRLASVALCLSLFVQCSGNTVGANCSVSQQDCGGNMFCNHNDGDNGKCQTCTAVDATNCPKADDRWPCCNMTYGTTLKVEYYENAQCTGTPQTAIFSSDQSCSDYFATTASSGACALGSVTNCCSFTDASVKATMDLTDTTIYANSAKVDCTDSPLISTSECNAAAANLTSLLPVFDSSICPKAGNTWTKSSCGVKSCIDAFKATTDEMIKTSVQQLEPCNIYQGYFVFRNETFLKGTLDSIASLCGITDVGYTANACIDIVRATTKVQIDCPTVCQTNIFGCKDQPERSPQSCGTAECASALTNLNRMDVSASMCPKSYASRLGLDNIQNFRFATNVYYPVQCGLNISASTTDLCVRGLEYITKFDAACPMQCTTEETSPLVDTGLPKCTATQSPYNPAQCGTAECLAVIQEGLDKASLYQSYLKTCTGDLGSIADSLPDVDAFVSQGLGYARDCKIIGNVSSDSMSDCSKGMLELMKGDVSCALSCYDEERGPQFNLPKCGAGAVNRTFDSCGTVTCKKYVDDFEKNVDTIRSNVAKCTGRLTSFATVLGTKEYTLDLVKQVRDECEVDSGKKLAGDDGESDGASIQHPLMTTAIGLALIQLFV